MTRVEYPLFNAPLTMPHLKHYWLTMGGLLAFFLLLFAVAEALHPPLLSDPLPWLERGGTVAALTGVGLLLADLFLPVPSSLVMIAHGALFGVIGGTFLSLTGSVGATVLGFALGRQGETLLARVVPPDKRQRANQLLERWGALAILVTRPVPLLAETVAIMAGTSPLGWGKAVLAALLGSAPAALLYAITGATALSLESGLLAFALVLSIAALAWWLTPRRVPVAQADADG